MRLITEYDANLDRIEAHLGDPTGESTCEEEDRSLSLLKAGTLKRTEKTGSSSQVPTKIPKKETILTEVTSKTPAVDAQKKTTSEEITIEDIQLICITLFST